MILVALVLSFFYSVPPDATAVPPDVTTVSPINNHYFTYEAIYD